MFRIWLPPKLRRLCRAILLLVAAVTLLQWFTPLVWSIYAGLACYGVVTALAAAFCLYFYAGAPGYTDCTATPGLDSWSAA